MIFCDNRVVDRTVELANKIDFYKNMEYLTMRNVIRYFTEILFSKKRKWNVNVNQSISR